MRSGRYITQPTGYKAFIPSDFPPSPPVQIENEIQSFLLEAEKAMASLNTLGVLVPNPSHVNLLLNVFKIFCG